MPVTLVQLGVRSFLFLRATMKQLSNEFVAD